MSTLHAALAAKAATAAAAAPPAPPPGRQGWVTTHTGAFAGILVAGIAAVLLLGLATAVCVRHGPVGGSILDTGGTAASSRSSDGRAARGAPGSSGPVHLQGHYMLGAAPGAALGPGLPAGAAAQPSNQQTR